MHHEPKFIAMAEVLAELGAELEALGEVLCRDPDFAGRHLRELQAIDLIAQKQRALATILAAGFSAAEMRRINLETLRSRFGVFIDDRSIGIGPPLAASVPDDALGLWD
jgi:hypothetical protein